MDQIDSDRRSRSEHRSSGKWWKSNECFYLFYINDNNKENIYIIGYLVIAAFHLKG